MPDSARERLLAELQHHYFHTGLRHRPFSATGLAALVRERRPAERWLAEALEAVDGGWSLDAGIIQFVHPREGQAAQPHVRTVFIDCPVHGGLMIDLRPGVAVLSIQFLDRTMGQGTSAEALERGLREMHARRTLRVVHRRGTEPTEADARTTAPSKMRRRA